MIRKPRAWLNLDTGLAVNLLHAEVTVNRDMTSSSFIVKMAVDDSSNPGLAYWEDTAPIKASVVANNGDGSSGLETLIQGSVDTVEIDYDTRIVTVHGSDATAQMLDTRSDEHFPNMTAGAIVSKIAGKHGLNPVIDGDTTMAGKTYDLQNFAFNSDYENEWDVIQSLAKHEGKIAYVSGSNLHFTSPENQQSQGVYLVTYTPPNEVPSLGGGRYGQMSLRTLRNLQMENFEASSASWHPQEKKAVTDGEDAPDSSIQDSTGQSGTSGLGGGFG